MAMPYRFECNKRIQFAVQQEKQAHEAELKQQRVDLLRMFQKDRDELIEDSKTELETLKRNLDSEHKIRTDREIRLSVLEIQRSTDDKMNDLKKQNDLLRSELEDMEKLIHDEVE